MDSINIIDIDAVTANTSPASSPSAASSRVRPSLVIDTTKSHSWSKKGGSKSIADEERRARIRREKEERELVERAQREEIQRRGRQLEELSEQHQRTAMQQQNQDSEAIMNQAGAASGIAVDNGIHMHRDAHNDAISMQHERDNSYVNSGSDSQMRDHFNGHGMHGDDDDENGQPEQDGNNQDQEDDHQGQDEGEGEEEEEEEHEQDEEDEDDEEDDQLSSSPSVPDEHIDFDLVYALHTFLATVEGQASVVKGDQLTLLDDTNSYWWLVRVLKTQAVGYIPAENIETPFERLARLNKHRNVGVSALNEGQRSE